MESIYSIRGQKGKDNDDLSDLENKSKQTQPDRQEPYHKSSLRLVNEFRIKESEFEFWPNRDEPRQQHLEPLETEPSFIPSLAKSWSKGEPMVDSIVFEDQREDHLRPKSEKRHKKNKNAKSEDRKNKSKIVQILVEMGYNENLIEMAYETISKKKGFSELSEEIVINRIIDLQPPMDNADYAIQPDPNRNHLGEFKTDDKTETKQTHVNCDRPLGSARPHSRTKRPARVQTPNREKFFTDKQLDQISDKQLNQDNDKRLKQDNDKQLNQDNDKQLKQDNDKQLNQDNDKQLKQDNDKQLNQDNDKQLKQKTDKKLKQETDKQLKQENDKQLKQKTDKRLKQDNDKQLKQKTDKQLKQESDKQLKQENDKQLKQKTDKQLKQESDKQLKQENDEQLKQKTDKHLKQKTDKQLKQDNDKQLKQDNDKQTLYICLKGLPENPNRESMCDFLESRMKKEIDRSSVLFCEKDDIAVVAFIEKIDFSILEEELQKRTFEGKYLKACRVELPQSVVVSHSSDSLTKEDLHTYFKDQYKSGGGHILSCDERGGFFIIRFRSHKEVESVCDPTRPQKVKNVKIKVTPRFECRFGELWDYKKHPVKLPEDMIVTWLDRDIEKFLISNKSSFKINDISMFQQGHFAEVCCVDGKKLCIKCLLTQQMPDVRKIVKTWTTDVRETFDDLVMKSLHKINIPCMSHDIWQKLKTKLGEIHISEDMNVLEDEENVCFILIGLKIVVENNQKKILEMKKNIEEEIERKNKIVHETKPFTSGKIYILETEGVIAQVNTIADDLDVFTDRNAEKIYFRGIAEDVCEAMVKIYEALNEKIVNKMYGLSSLQTKLIENVVDLIHEAFKLQNIRGTVETSSEKIEIITSSRGDNERALKVVRNFTRERVIDLRFESLSVLDKPEWFYTTGKMKENHKKKVLMKIQKSDSLITVAATWDIFDEVFEELKSVIDHNTIILETIKVDNNCFFYFLQQFWTDGCEKLLKDLSTESVQIEMHEDSLDIEVSGTKSGIEQAKSCLRQELKNIKQTKYVKKGCGISKVIEENMETLLTSCSKHKTIVSLTDSDGTQAFVKDKKMYDSGGPLKLKNGTVVSIIVGDIAATQADVLVCTVSHNLNLSAGKACSSLLQAGGESLQVDCKTKCPNGIKDGEIVSVKGGNLSCKKVYFGALPKLNAETKPNLHKIIIKFMQDCVTKAEKSGLTSIIFLALGTGDLGYPETEVAESMYKYILDLDKFHYRCKIKNVGFVVHHKNKETLKAFKAEEKRLKSDLQKYLKTEHSGIKCRNGTLIKLVKGEIANEQGDVIVCGTSKDLNLSSGKSCRKLLQVGGQKLQDECKKKYPEGIEEGEIAVVKGCGNLKCKEVYFGALPDWKTEHSKHHKKLWKFVETCMLKAHESGYTTIVFAALGTGALGYPPDRAAHLMFDSVIKFDNSHDPRSALKNVKFVVYYQDHQTIRGYFQKESELLRSLYDGTHGKKNPKIKTKVIEGHIEMQQVDVIACNVSPKLNLRHGKVTHFILKKGGQSLDSECAGKYPDGIEIGQLAIIGSGNLSCQQVYLGVLPKYEEDEDNSKKVLFDFIMKCLSTASANGFQSIAFPAVGTGDFNHYPHHVVASIIFKAVANFERQNLGSLTEVCCVVLHKDEKSLQAFRTVEKIYFSPSYMQASLHRPKTNPAFNQQTKDLQNEVSLWLYSDSMANIEKAKTDIDKLIESKIPIKVIKDELVGQLPRDKRNEIMNITKMYTGVRIEVKTGQNEIVLEGIAQVLIEVSDQVHNILRSYQRELHIEREAKFMAEGFLWHYKERSKNGEKYIPYSEKVSLKLEQAYKNGEKQLEISIGDKQHTVDFVEMQEYPNDNKSDVVYVIRKQTLTAGAYPLPDFWEAMEENDMVLTKKLNSSSQEYKNVEKKFIDSVFQGQIQQQKQLFLKSKFSVSEIIRIQNKTLYQQYEAKKDQLKNQNPTGTQNEQAPLWHGTAPDVIDSIIYNGFNRSYCLSAKHNINNWKNMAWFGDGVYFSNDASYSCQHWLTPQNSSGIQNMFMVRVLCGMFCQGNPGMRVLGERTKNICYDSAVDNLYQPTEFIIFNDTQAYPEYLIKFTS